MKCPECKKYIEADLVVHFYGHHSMVPKTICPMCGKVILITGIKGLWD